MGKLDIREIGGYTTYTQEFACLDQAEFGWDLAKILLPGLTHFVNSGLEINTIEDIMQLELEYVIAMIVSMLQSASGKEARRLMFLLLQNTNVLFNGERYELNTVEKINYVFDGRTKDMIKTVGVAIEVSFLGFFPEGLKGKSENEPVNQS